MPTGRHTTAAPSRRRRRRLAAALAGVLASAGVAAPALMADAAVAFPDCPTTTLTRTGEQTSGIRQSNPGGTWDLTGATFSDPDLFPYPIRSDSWTRGCIVGGRVLGPIDPAATRDQWYNGGTHGGADHEGVRLDHGSGTSTAVIRGTYVEDVEDGFDPNAPTSTSKTYLDRVHASWVRDDCIENEKVVHSMYVRDSLFDGCFAAFAEKPDSSSADAGTGNADFVVEGSLVYVRPQPLGSRYCSDSAVTRGRCVREGDHWLGAYGMFKWGASAASRVVVRDTIFRMDLASYSSCSGNRFPTNGTYENVTLVWTGPGSWTSAGGCTNVVPKGVTVTKDVTVWDKAKAAWLAGSSPTPTPEPTPTPDPTPTPTPDPTPEPTPTPTPDPTPEPTPQLTLVCPVPKDPAAGDQVTCTYRAQ